jgi:hypothetical protein
VFLIVLSWSSCVRRSQKKSHINRRRERESKHMSSRTKIALEQAKESNKSAICLNLYNIIYNLYHLLMERSQTQNDFFYIAAKNDNNDNPVII